MAIKGTSATFACDGILISGDVHVEFFNKKFTKGLMFDFWFHTQFIINDFLSLSKSDLDKGEFVSILFFGVFVNLISFFFPFSCFSFLLLLIACKEKGDSLYPTNFKVEVYFKSVGDQSDVFRRPSSAVAYSNVARSAIETAKLKLDGKIPLASLQEGDEDTSSIASIQECAKCLKAIDLAKNVRVHRSNGLYFHWECLT